MTSTQFVDWMVWLADDIKREYDHRHKWEYYAADIISLLAEIAYDLRGVLVKAQPQMFRSDKMLRSFTFESDKPEDRVVFENDDVSQLSPQEQEAAIRASKSVWFGMLGLGQEV